MKRVFSGIAMVVTVCLLLWAGIGLRAAIWDWTMPLRFNHDIENGYGWGTFATRIGYFNVYDELGEPTRDRMDTHLAVDYGPLRLGVMTAWVQWLHVNYPQAQERDPSAAFHAPLLWFNTAAEFATSVATFILVMLVLQPDRWRPWIALSGAALTWFNPLILINAHAWPQWDIWPMPFYLFAVCCCLRRRWLAAGVLIGIGAMLKGQILMIAWVLPVWALLIGDWRGSLKILIGAAASIMLIGIVWELSIYLPGQDGYDLYTAHSAAASVRRIDWPAIAWVALWIVAALALPRRFSMTLICLAVALSLGSTYWLFNATPYWLQSALVVGTWHFPSMQMGTTANLATILARNYGWQDPNELLFTLYVPITMRTLLLLIYFTTSAWCAVWAAINDKRRDPRVLLAICLPWLLFYCLPAQIHERYVIFFSACVGVLVACGARWVCLGMVMTLMGWLITVHNMFRARGIPRLGLSNPRHTLFTVAHEWIGGTFPGSAWILLLIAAIYLFAIAGKPTPGDQ